MAISTVSPSQLRELCSKGEKFDLIDVRTPIEFRAVHLEMARNVPLDQLDPAALTNARGGAASQPLYVVCHSGARGRQACEKLIEAGLANVANVEGGTTACIQAGLPVVRGKAAISLERQVRIAAGSLALVGSLLAWWVHLAFIGVPAIVGAGLLVAGITDNCAMGMILGRMPWNQCGQTAQEGRSGATQRQSCKTV